VTVNIQKQKIAWIFGPVVITDNDDPVGAFGDANPVSVDTLGWSRATIYVRLGASDIAVAAMGVYSGPAAAVGADDATYTAITGLQASGTTGVGRLPTADDDNKTFAFDIDLKAGNIGRYLALDFTAGNGSTGSYQVAFCILSEPNEAPSTSAGRGLEWELANF
jgi:hypothetical protein